MKKKYWIVPLIAIILSFTLLALFDHTVKYYAKSHIENSYKGVEVQNVSIGHINIIEASIDIEAHIVIHHGDKFAADLPSVSFSAGLCSYFDTKGYTNLCSPITIDGGEMLIKYEHEDNKDNSQELHDGKGFQLNAKNLVVSVINHEFVAEFANVGAHIVKFTDNKIETAISVTAGIGTVTTKYGIVDSNDLEISRFNGHWNVSSKHAKLTRIVYNTQSIPDIEINGGRFIYLAKNVMPIESIDIDTIKIGEQTISDTSIQITDKKLFIINTKLAQVKYPLISPDPVTFKDVVTLVSPFDAFDNDIMFMFNHVTAQLLWDRSNKSITGVVDCKSLPQIFPEELSDPIKNIEFYDKFNGNNKFNGNLELGTNTAYWVNYGNKPTIKIVGCCYAKCDSPPLKALRSAFSYKIYASNGDRIERTSGPGSKDWAPISTISDSLITAVITMEDPGFLHHNGFIPQAFENSLKDNLKLGKIIRGGSTITMQLAKNLWLSRNKTIGRKAQEFYLAQAIESCFSKQEIMELYLNIVEFGPDLYGISPATREYFKKSPIELSPVESFYLASVLPRPQKAGKPSEATLKRIRSLMSRFADSGKISDYLISDANIDDSEWGQ